MLMWSRALHRENCSEIKKSSHIKKNLASSHRHKNALLRLKKISLRTKKKVGRKSSGQVHEGEGRWALGAELALGPTLSRRTWNTLPSLTLRVALNSFRPTSSALHAGRPAPGAGIQVGESARAAGQPNGADMEQPLQQPLSSYHSPVAMLSLC